MLSFKNEYDQGLIHDDSKQRNSQSAISRSLRNRTIAREKLIAIIEQELREDLRKTPSVNQLAESFYVSPRTLSRRLSSAGINYRTLVAEVKKEAAIVYLTETDLLVSDVARKVGYTDKSNFSKAFKSWTGVTPMVYRTTH